MVPNHFFQHSRHNEEPGIGALKAQRSRNTLLCLSPNSAKREVGNDNRTWWRQTPNKPGEEDIQVIALIRFIFVKIPARLPCHRAEHTSQLINPTRQCQDGSDKNNSSKHKHQHPHKSATIHHLLNFRRGMRQTHFSPHLMKNFFSGSVCGMRACYWISTSKGNAKRGGGGGCCHYICQWNSHLTTKAFSFFSTHGESTTSRACWQKTWTFPTVLVREECAHWCHCETSPV